MKDFSNETKSKRRKAILKVILKRYSFIVWVPALLALLNFIGIITMSILNLTSPPFEGGMFYIYFANIMTGIGTIMGIVSILLVIHIIISSCIEYLKKGTIFEDIKLIIEILIDIVHLLIELPKKIFLRLKDEKRRFNNSLEKELRRSEND